MEDWHTYTCEWDPEVIRYYLDGAHIRTVWRYHRQYTETKWWDPTGKTYIVKKGSGCNPAAGDYHTTEGFPFDHDSKSNLRFTLTGDPDAGYSSGLVGEMEIDYVKIWQRNPSNGWTNLCDPASSIISGPDIVCEPSTFSAVPASGSGYWYPPTSNLTTLSSSASSIVVQPNPASTNHYGEVYYYGLDPTCPTASGYFLQWKGFDVGAPNSTSAIGVYVNSPSSGTAHYKFHADPDYFGASTPMKPYKSSTTFEWTFTYGPGLTASINAFGQFVSTPAFVPNPSPKPDTVLWHLVVSNACGSVIKSGRKIFYKMPGARIAPAPPSQGELPSYVASISNPEAYNHAVSTRLENYTFDPNASPTTISSKIEHIELEELEPYLVLNAADSQSIFSRQSLFYNEDSSAVKENTSSTIFPNPARNEIAVVPDDRFGMDFPIELRIYSVTGTLLKTAIYSASIRQAGMTLDISDLSSGYYIAELMQGEHVDRLQLMKY